jgi:hypothetical protein
MPSHQPSAPLAFFLGLNHITRKPLEAILVAVSCELGL